MGNYRFNRGIRDKDSIIGEIVRGKLGFKRSIRHNYLAQGVDSAGGEDTGPSPSLIGDPRVEHLSGISTIIDRDTDIRSCQAALTSIDPVLHFSTMFQEALFR